MLEKVAVMVSSVLGTALSGLRASETRIAVAADNVANSSTRDYKAAKVIQTSQEPQGGVKANVVKTDRAPDIEEEVINANVASYDFKANLNVIQAQRNLDKHLFDIQA